MVISKITGELDNIELHDYGSIYAAIRFYRF